MQSTTKSRQLWVAVAGLLLFAVAAYGRLCVSVMLSNVGMIRLNHALGASARAASPQQLEDVARWFTRSLAWDAGNLAAHRGLGWIWEARGDMLRAGREWAQGGFSAPDFLMCADKAASVAQDDVCQLWLWRAAAMQP